jgi:hypothetical protein
MRSSWDMGEGPHDEGEDEDEEDSFGLSRLSWRPWRRFVLGVDRGQLQDPTALVIGERSTARDVVVQVRHLQRYSLTTSSPAVVGHMAQMLSIPPLREQAALACDATGLGAAVSDRLTEAHLSPFRSPSPVAMEPTDEAKPGTASRSVSCWAACKCCCRPAG